jgi:hypothetical protein
MGLIFRLFALVGLLFTLGIFALVGIVGYLYFAGGASRPDCASPPSTAAEQARQSVAFDSRLAVFIASGGRAPPAVTFDEAGAQARAELYLSERTDLISDLALCFEEGKATGFLRIDAPLGRKLGVRAEGTLDLSGEHPVLVLSSASAAGIGAPGFLRGRIEDAVNDELRSLQLGFPLTLQFGADQATLSR